MNVESRSLYASFYEDVIGVGKELVEIRIQHLEKKYMFSRYVENLEQLISIFKRFNNYPYNIYYGINSRKIAGRKDADIEFRKVFYFDIEKDGDKPNLEEDLEYRIQLEKTTEYICNEMENKFGFKPCALIQSGRGFHLYYQHLPLRREEYDSKFKIWWKRIIEELKINKPIKEIKFDDSVFNCGRIASAPGTNHQKYPEKPFRKIIKYAFENINNLKEILDKVEVPVYESKNIKKNVSKKKLFEEPVFKILKLGVSMNNGRYVNNTLMFCASLLCRDAKLTLEEIEIVNNKLVEWGYWKGIIIPSEQYNYNPKTITNWCIKNMDWCVEKQFKLPYKFIIIPFCYEVNLEEKEFEDRQLETMEDVLNYCSDYNKKYCHMNRNIWIFYKNNLIKKLEKNCKPTVKEFIELNNLWNLISVYRKDKVVINM